MPATWSATKSAVFGAYLMQDGWQLKDVAELVDCSDRAIKHANRVRHSCDHNRKLWRLLVSEQVRVGDAERLVAQVEQRFHDNPETQRRFIEAAVQSFEAGEIKHLRDYKGYVHAV